MFTLARSSTHRLYAIRTSQLARDGHGLFEFVHAIGTVMQGTMKNVFRSKSFIV